MPFDNQELSEEQAMQKALQEAEKGYGFVSPDPPVGCVVLSRKRRFLASGHYAHYGARHAEISALKKIKDKSLLKGAQLFVTLEPCAHFGKNPPCADALLQYPLGRVVYGMKDPNPLTQGKGIEKLQSAGMRVEKTRFLQEPVQRLYEAFALNKKKAQAFFALKTASSLDGVSALAYGESPWITGEQTREFTAQLRAFYDAVLIGAGTFLQDKPRLNSRPKGQRAPPANKVCILDPEGKTLELIARSPLAKVRPMENIFVITRQRPKKDFPFKILCAPALAFDFKKKPPIGPAQKKGFEVLPSAPPGLSYAGSLKPSFCFDLKALSEILYKEGVGSVLAEGGAETFSRCVEQGAAERLYWLINPCLFGGLQGRYWTEALKLPSRANKRISLSSTEVLQFGEDVLLTGVLA